MCYNISQEVINMTTDYPILYAIVNAFYSIFQLITTLAVLLAPFAIIAWFIESIVMFTKSEKGSRRRNIWRGNLIASSIVLGVALLFAIFIAIIIHLAQDAVIYM